MILVLREDDNVSRSAERACVTHIHAGSCSDVINAF